ncbi:MAG: GNAT family N-acetyltransferase [Candidatus Heimdallarchaeota archaeon]|nr:GNAT family N-acetyltransferase [Candidatus Heimdallarchaeota archaeon]
MIQELKNTEDLEKAANLAALCFHDPIKEMKEFYSQIQELEMIGIYEKSILTAAAGSYKFRIFIRDQILDCAGVANVMTDPAYRRKGYVKELMIKILEDSKNQGYPIAALWPFDHDFYRKFGFESGEKTITFKFKPGQIKSDFKIEDNITIEDVTEKNDFLPLIQVAENAQNKYTRVYGDVAAWQMRGKLQGFKTYLIERDGKPIAYISLKFKKVKEWEFNMNIMDLAYVDIEAKHTLFAFLKNFEADITNIFINLPYQEEVESYLTSVNDEHKFNQWPAMMRILDIQQCFEQLHYPKHLESKIYFKVEDKIISENSGIWELDIQEGKCKASVIEDGTVEMDKVLEITINQLTQILIGYSSIAKLLEHQKAKIPNEWTTKELFPEVPTAIMAWF